MAIHVIQSQRIEVLVEVMLTTVNQPAQTPFHVLQTQHYIVPSHAVEAWLTQKLAEKKSLNNVAAKVITKQITKFIPLGGQIIAASLGYVVMKKVAEAHVRECYKIAKGIQQKQQAQLVS